MFSALGEDPGDPQASVVERVRTAKQDKHPRGSFGYAQDRLFGSAPPNAVSRAKSVRRFAQDDDFAGVLKKNIPN